MNWGAGLLKVQWRSFPTVVISRSRRHIKNDEPVASPTVVLGLYEAKAQSTFIRGSSSVFYRSIVAHIYKLVLSTKSRVIGYALTEWMEYSTTVVRRTVKMRTSGNCI